MTLEIKKWLPALLLFSCLTKAQDFAWMRGSNNNGTITGVYGTQMVPSLGNDPGTRHGAAMCTDAAGNVWLFGGEGFSATNSYSMLNDLWKYDPTTNEWTWIRGSNGPNSAGNYGTQTVPLSTNEPRAREFAATWTDNQGNFWLFGGDAMVNQATYTLGRLSDLWKYDPVSNVWTWMKGPSTLDVNGTYGTLNTASPSNLPGARYAPASWRDNNGDLWMFGGRGYAAAGGNSHLNDLWKYSISLNQWTWMGGSNLSSQYGTYGTMGMPSTSNIPGGLEFPCSWKDQLGRLYLFAGRGYASSGNPGWLNDLWRYDPANGQWVWLKGTNATNQTGVYGTLGVASPSVLPGGRYSAASWEDVNGDFWLFGGFGWSTVASVSHLGDLFKYDAASNQFTWVKGSSSPSPAGIYGTMGQSAPANMPGARYFNNYCTGPGNAFWLFGGTGRDITGTTLDNLQDLWKLQLPCNPENFSASPSSSVCNGNSVSIAVLSPTSSGLISWYSSATSTSAIASGSVYNTPVLTSPSGPTVYTYYVSVPSCSNAPRSVVQISVSPSPTVTISGSTVACLGNTSTITASGALSYSWSTGASGANLLISPPTNTTYAVTGINGPGCTGLTSVSISVIPSPTVGIAALLPPICIGNAFTLTATGANSYTWNSGQTSSVITQVNNFSVNVVYTVTGTGGNGCTASTTISVERCVVGLKENKNEVRMFEFYPNPSHAEIEIKIPEPASLPSRLSIYDVTGRMVLNLELTSEINKLPHSLQQGIYWVELKNSTNRIQVAKLVVE